MPLSPESRSLLEMVYRVDAPRFHELGPEQARLSFEKMLFAFRPEVPPVAAVTELAMKRAAGSTLPARLYRPLSSSPADRLPLLLFYHGGGWCVGDVASYDVFCRQLANASSCAVLSVDYRLAPEHPFPAAVEDAVFALDWVEQHAEQIGIDGGRIALGGDSAGGNLALVTALGDLPLADRIRFLLLIYPSTQIHSERRSRIEYGDGYFLDREALQWFFERYLPAGNADHWQASPMNADSLTGLPPMLMITAQYDPLIDDCLAFAQRARAEGCTVETHEVQGVLHGFITLGKLFPQAEPALRLAAARLATALQKS